MANTIEESLKDIFLAGVGALAVTGEKAKEMVDGLIEKGELSVEQGKEINQELQHKANDAISKIRSDTLERYIANMSEEERKDFAAQVNRMVEQAQEDKTAAEIGSEKPSA